MVIFQYNLYIFGIHFWTVLYPKSCYNESCYKEVEVYLNKPTPYHIYSKIWTSTIYYRLLCLNIAAWVANSVEQKRRTEKFKVSERLGYVVFSAKWNYEIRICKWSNHENKTIAKLIYSSNITYIFCSSKPLLFQKTKIHVRFLCHGKLD